MDTSKEKARPYSYSPQESLEVNHGLNGGDLEVAGQDAPEKSYRPYPDSEQNILYSNDQQQQQQPPERRRVCGVTPLIFWILIFALVIILAAGLGGGLGVGLSQKNTNKTANDNAAAATQTTPLPTPAHDPEPTTIPDHSPSTSTTPPSPATAPVSCPSNDTLVYTPPSLNTLQSTAYAVNDTTLTYTIHCNTSYTPNEDIADIQYIPNSNLSHCIQACSLFNVQYPDGGGEFGFWNLCSGLTVTGSGECQLKTGVDNDAKGVNGTRGGESAMLLW